MTATAAADAGLTPMMAQYRAMKDEHSEAVLLFRLGDFYEIFFEDAPVVAKLLGIQLTRRNRQGGEDIPMCGIPWHQLDNYLPDLLNANLKVAICDQLETPEEAKRRGSKAPLRRGITRIVTPGTVVEETLIGAAGQKILASFCMDRDTVGLAWGDIASGTLEVASLPLAEGLNLLFTLDPAEVLVPLALQHEEKLANLSMRLNPQADSVYTIKTAGKRLAAAYGMVDSDGFGSLPPLALAAAAALTEYLQHTYRETPIALKPPRLRQDSDRLILDAATVRNLELFTSLNGTTKASLFAVLDKTVTSGGKRLLKDWLRSPAASPASINARLDSVQCALENRSLRESVRGILADAGDMERALTRLALRRGAPRDLLAVRDGLRAMEKLATASHGQALPPLLRSFFNALPIALELTATLERAVKDPPPPTAREGGILKVGYHPKIDELRDIEKNSQQLLIKLEAKYRTAHSVATLKIRHNNLIGYHIEVPVRSADALMPVFRHRQTMANAVRFSSPELEELEQQILTGATELRELEYQIYEELVNEALAQQQLLRAGAEALANIDVLFGLAEVAQQRRYVRPVVDASPAFEINGGRHPVVEALLSAGTAFVANDCDLAPARRLWVLTGPNMAGKSTFLRQNALIAIMAHLGSFVPADAAHIGLVDRVFSRIGAGDDLARGQSTFMVEMLETSAILHQSTPRSLVILDEVGRGTATHDGLALAAAIIEYLHDTSLCRTLFATHYHELSGLADTLPRLHNRHAAVKLWQDDLVFLHTIKPGAAGMSHGIHVARKAGVPVPVVRRAEVLLRSLEKHSPAFFQQHNTELVGLFAPSNDNPVKLIDPLREALEALSPDGLSPKEALALLYRWKEEFSL